MSPDRQRWQRLSGDRSVGGCLGLTERHCCRCGGHRRYCGGPCISDISGRRPVSEAETGSAGDRAGRATTEEDSKKAYRRGRYAEQKVMIEAIKREIETLDQEIPGLWNQFYAWDDPAYRDGVIKVQLDQKMARRDELAKQLPEEEAKLPEILNEARRDGALPGWFRDIK